MGLLNCLLKMNSKAHKKCCKIYTRVTALQKVEQSLKALLV